MPAVVSLGEMSRPVSSPASQMPVTVIMARDPADRYCRACDESKIHHTEIANAPIRTIVRRFSHEVGRRMNPIASSAMLIIPTSMGRFCQVILIESTRLTES